MTIHQQPDASAAPSRQHYGLTLAVLVVSAMAYALSQTLVAPALPEIQRELETSTTAVTYVLTAYLLTASISTPVIGRLGDMFGKKRTLVWTLIIFAAGSLVAALSTSIEMLIAGRAIQGAGGAVFPLAFGIIRDEFPREKVGRGIGLISATFGIGGGAGVVLSGPIVENLGYAGIFWLGLVVVVVAVLATHWLIPESPITSPARIDWVGAALLSGGLVALLVGVSEGNSWGWTDPRLFGLFAAAAALLVWFGIFESRHPQPLVDMTMMRARAVLMTNLTALLVGFGMFSSFILIPQFVQAPTDSGYGFGASVTEAGLFLLPSTAVMLVAGPLAGWLGERYGSRTPLLIGTAVAMGAFAFLAVEHSEPWSVYLATGLFGLGIGFSFAAMANLIIEAVEPSRTGVATGMNTIMRTIGGAIGGQIAASILSGHLGASGLPSESGFTAAFAMSAGGLAAALLLAAAIPTRRRMAMNDDPQPVSPDPCAGAGGPVGVPAGPALRGRVTREHGEALPAAVLTVITAEGRQAARTRTDEAGDYALDLAPGRYVVLAAGAGRRPHAVDVEVNGEPVHLDLSLRPLGSH